MTFKNLFMENKIAILIYIVLLSAFSLSFTITNDLSNSGFEIGVFIVLLILGIISIIYYGKNKKNLYKVAFVIILMFGIVSLLLAPINDISDESEHLSRVEIVSQGQISTSYVQIPGSDNFGYQTIGSIDEFANEINTNVFNTHLDDEKINKTPGYFHSAFAQNPFYGYLIPAIGMFIAKLLDLNAIWILWLPRFANLLLYAFVVSIAIKKSPVYKIPLFFVSIVPLAIYQAASVSADCFFNAFAILSIAYFFVLYKSDSIQWKDLGIFFISILLCGLLKLPYLALSLLIFLIPKDNFKDRKQGIISKLGILVLLGIGVIWSSYGTSQIFNSWRAIYNDVMGVNATQQVQYLLSDPMVDVTFFFKTFACIPEMFNRLFYFSCAGGEYNSLLLSVCYSLFIVIALVISPLKEKFSLNNRLKAVLIGILIYVSVFLVQYITWGTVRTPDISNGVSARYFIPLMIFIPLIFNIDTKNKINKDKFMLIAMGLAVSFIAGMLMLTLAVKY